MMASLSLQSNQLVETFTRPNTSITTLSPNHNYLIKSNPGKLRAHSGHTLGTLLTHPGHTLRSPSKNRHSEHSDNNQRTPYEHLENTQRTPTNTQNSEHRTGQINKQMQQLNISYIDMLLIFSYLLFSDFSYCYC